MSKAIIEVFDTPDSEYSFDIRVEFEPPFKLIKSPDMVNQVSLAQDFAMSIVEKLRQDRDIEP